jgi:uncharacterized membrane protein YfcA
LVAFLASGLSFFSGFGLGTLLLPAFALFYSAEQAVALTAVVHFLNGIFKLGLVGRYVNWQVLLRFGVPAVVAAFIGASMLVHIARLDPLFEYTLLGHHFVVKPASFLIGVVLLVFALLELSTAFERLAFPARYMPVGGFLTGFFGGLTGLPSGLPSSAPGRSCLILLEAD